MKQGTNTDSVTWSQKKLNKTGTEQPVTYYSQYVFTYMMLRHFNS